MEAHPVSYLSLTRSPNPTGSEPAPAPTVTQLTPSRSGVLVVDGFGITMRVERHSLTVAGGICEERTEARLSKISGLTRLVLSGHVNFITGEALEWLRGVGATLLILDREGRMLFSSTEPDPGQPRLRRAQALAPFTGAGLDLTRMLLGRKLRGQAETLRQQSWPDHIAAAAEAAAAGIETTSEALGRVSSMDQLRTVEARAASLYWDVLEHVKLDWARKDTARVRDHWRTLGTRRSPLTGSPQRAVTPGHAMLNYAYALLEAETVLECQAAGLDTSIDVGPLHADKDYRPSLASTIMESARPAVDALMVDFLRHRTLHVSEFFENREGHVRIMPPLTRELAELMPTFREAVCPMVQAVVDYLLECGSDYAALAETLRPKPAPLAYRETERRTPRTRPIRPGVAAIPAVPIRLTQQRCAHCEALTDANYCSPECARDAATLASLAPQLADPARRTPEAWALLYPAILRVPARRIQATCKVSPAAVSLWKSGRRTPQSRYWPLLCRA
jgi:CRISPR-associated endonuclease Cas1